MKYNLLALILIAALTYAVTLYIGQKDHHNNAATNQIIEAPNSDNVIETVPETEQIPDFSFTTIEGKTYNIRDFTNKIVIINFWASWCAPCVVEFPNLIDIAKSNDSDLVLIALSSDLDEQAIHRFVKKMKAQQNLDISANNIFIALDENQAITNKMFQTFKLPETLIIDKDQRLQHKLIGANWEKTDLTALLQPLQRNTQK